MKSLSYSIYLPSISVQMDNDQWTVQGRGSTVSLVALRKGRKDGEKLSELCTFSSVRHRLPTVSASIKENKTDTCPVSDSMITPKRLCCGQLNNREKKENQVTGMYLPKQNLQCLSDQQRPFTVTVSVFTSRLSSQTSGIKIMKKST